MTEKVALITGITGQDGAYLAEFLLRKGYIVHGLKRRSSLFNTERIDHLYHDRHEDGIKFFLHYSDMTDSSNLISLIQKIQPDEIYNLAAMSHVQVSFDLPEYTGNADGLGTLRLLEAVRLLGLINKTKVYQASTSELFGLVQEVPQNEKTPFYPRSPYGVAKLYGYWITVNYREAYGLYACNGILFNHECISENIPLIIKENNFISIKRVKDIKRAHEKGANTQQWIIKDDIKIWDGENFVRINGITATKRNKKLIDHQCKTINTRHGVVETTNHHNLLDINSIKVKASEVNIGNKLLHKDLPLSVTQCSITEEEALFLGLMVADGHISGRKAKFTNNNNKILDLVSNLWFKLTLGNTSIQSNISEKSFGKSKQLSLLGNKEYLYKISKEIYTFDKFKKVPDRIFNSNMNIQLKFLEGYNLGDGLKKSKSRYSFVNFKTNSPVLAQGLIFLISNTTGQDFNITFEVDEKYYGYYSINFLSDSDKQDKLNDIKELMLSGTSQRSISSRLEVSRTTIRKIQNNLPVYEPSSFYKDRNEVKKCFYHNEQPTWVYDIETESGKFLAGVGKIIISNSPIRGETFVTRKITRAVARIALGLQNDLFLGNLGAKRDWGHAKDYVEAMYLILQQDTPEDYVIATGKTTEIRDFVKMAFDEVGIEVEFSGTGINEKGFIKSFNMDVLKSLDIDTSHLVTGKEVVLVDKKYFRPAEVDFLIGDSTKAKTKLGWMPKYDLPSLVKDMVISDLQLMKKEKYIKDAGYRTLNYFE